MPDQNKRWRVSRFLGSNIVKNMFSKGPASSGDPRWQQQYRTSERHSKTRVFGSDPKHWKTYLPSSIHQRPTQKHSKTRRVFGFDDQKHVFLGLNKNTEKHFLPSRVVIYTPKEAHNRIFVTGGSVTAWQMLAKTKFKIFLGAASHTSWPPQE